MDIKEMRGKSEKELNDQIGELRREQFNLRMQKGSGQLTKTHQFGLIRREIAQIKTVLGSKK